MALSTAGESLVVPSPSAPKSLTLRTRRCSAADWAAAAVFGAAATAAGAASSVVALSVVAAVAIEPPATAKPAITAAQASVDTMAFLRTVPNTVHPFALARSGRVNRITGDR